MSILDRVRGLEIVLVNSDEQFQRAMEIRRCVYCDELSWITPEAIPDEWDSQGVHLLASRDGRAVATARINERSSGLEVEKYISLADYRSSGTCAEVSRLCVLAGERFPLIAVGMLYAATRYALANNIRFFCITAPQMHRRLYTNVGFRYVAGPFRNEIVGAPPLDAYVLDFVGAPLEGPWVENWAKRHPRMLGLFLQPIEGIG
jgi:predicted GNAT family N-acyltransferase